MESNKWTFIPGGKLPFEKPRTRGYLPHLIKDGGTYFVTIRLADAVLGHHEPRPKTVSLRWFQLNIEPPLTLGTCLLRNADHAAIVKQVLLNREDVDYKLWSWCIMPNHIHAVLTTAPEIDLRRVVSAWKSVSAHQIGLGTLWEPDSFDHLIRSARSLNAICRYVEQNPVAAGLCRQPEQFEFSSAYAA